MVGTQIAIREAPPAAGEAKDRVQPQMRRGDIDKHQAAAGSQQSVDVAQSHTNIAHGVNHVGAENDVE